MNVKISGHHLDVTPALRKRVLARLKKILRHFRQVLDITVRLIVERRHTKKHRQKAKISLHVQGKGHGRGKILSTESAANDLYAAIDNSAETLDRQVRRHKGKLQNNKQINRATRADAASLQDEPFH